MFFLLLTNLRKILKLTVNLSKKLYLCIQSVIVYLVAIDELISRNYIKHINTTLLHRVTSPIFSMKLNIVVFTFDFESTP